MPYASPEDLPSSIRDNLPVHAQRIFLSAFNSAASSGASEQDCMKIAWAAVKKSYRQDRDSGTWQANPKEEAADVTVKGNDFEQFDEAFIPSTLSEQSIQNNGTARIRIIKPGWGSSGYYPESMLERDAAKVYTPGLHMYLDHPTTAEEKARPERSVKDLAGIIEGNVAYEKNNPGGPGVYADAHIFAPYRGLIKEMSQHIGLSHRAEGNSKPGQAEGRSGRIIESLEKAFSVDFVTKPGAGGGLVKMYESWRPTEGQQNTQSETNTNGKTKTEESMTLTLTELKETRPDLIEAIKAEIQESETEKGKAKLLEESERKNKEQADIIARLTEAQAITTATAIVTEAVKAAKVPDLAKPRIVESILGKVTLKEGKLDEDAFKATITEALKTETDFYAKLMETGKIRGFGSSQPADADARKALKESYKEDFIRAGKSAAEAEKMAEIAATGRR
ncbi:MAG: ChaB family protein [Methanoregula sp.]|nr:ChaB family protein [Methanoregula sp.]